MTAKTAASRRAPTGTVRRRLTSQERAPDAARLLSRSIATLLTALFPTACARPPGEARSRPPAGGPGTGVMAEVDGSVITREELDRQVEGRLTRLQQEEYEMRRGGAGGGVSEGVVEGGG